MVHRALLISILLLLAQSRVPPLVPDDPASDLVRVRAFLTTTSTSVDLTVAGAEWANAVSPDSSIRAIIDGHTLHVTRKNSGEADVRLEIVLGSVHAGTSVSGTG